MSNPAVERLGGLPAEIRDSDFALIARTTVAGVARAIADAGPGVIDRYGYVSVSLPGGATVGTSLALADAAAIPAEELCMRLGTLPAVAAFLSRGDLGVPLAAAWASPLSEDCAAATGAAARQGRFPPGTRIRLYPGSGARRRHEAGEDLQDEPPVRISRAASDPPATVSLWLGDAAPFSAVIAPGTIVDLAPALDAISITLATGVPIVDDMMRMRADGRITEVASILGGMPSDAPLRHLDQYPAASVLIGYGFLRTQQPETMHASFQQIAARRADFADPAVLAGETAARMGHHADALRFFLQAVDAGLPAFSFGVNYLVDRLRAYAPLGQGPVTDPELNAQALAALQRVQDYAPAMVHNAVLTAYKLDIAG